MASTDKARMPLSIAGRNGNNSIRVWIKRIGEVIFRSLFMRRGTQMKLLLTRCAPRAASRENACLLD